MPDRQDEIFHGDVYENLRELDTASAHAAVVDFPWMFESGRLEDLDWPRQPDGFLIDLFDELTRVLVPGAWVFVFADDEQYPIFRRRVESSTLTHRQTLIWDKSKMGMGHYFRMSHAPIIAATHGETERFVQDRRTIIETPISDSDYPTSKPTELYKELLKPPVLHPGERLLEPFCGTAPGLDAARSLEANYWGCDINEEAVGLATERLEQQKLTEVS